VKGMVDAEFRTIGQGGVAAVVRDLESANANGRFPSSIGAALFPYVREEGLKRIGTDGPGNGQLGTDVTARIQEGGWQFKTTNAAWVWPRPLWHSVLPT